MDEHFLIHIYIMPQNTTFSEHDLNKKELICISEEEDLNFCRILHMWALLLIPKQKILDH